MTINERKAAYDEFEKWVRKDWKYNIPNTLFSKMLSRKQSVRGGFAAFAIKGAKDKGALDDILINKDKTFSHYVAFCLNKGTGTYKKWIVQNEYISNVFIDEKGGTHILFRKNLNEDEKLINVAMKEVEAAIKTVDVSSLETLGFAKSFINFLATENLAYANLNKDFGAHIDVRPAILSLKDYNPDIDDSIFPTWGLPSFFRETRYKPVKERPEDYEFKISESFSNSSLKYIDIKGSKKGDKNDRVLIMPVQISELVLFMQKVKKETGSVDDIFSLNVRDRKKNGVSKAILNSVLTSPQDFLMLNNGITAIVDDISETTTNGNVSISLENIKIINGQQTTMSLYAHWEKMMDDGNTPLQFDDAYILMKAYKIDKNKKNYKELYNKISNASNKQTAIKSKDLLSTRSFNETLRKNLLKLGISYSFRDGKSDYSSQFNGMPKITLNELIKAHYIYLTGEAWKRGSIGSVFDGLSGAVDTRETTPLGKYIKIFNSKTDEELSEELTNVATMQLLYKSNKKELDTNQQALDMMIYIGLLLERETGNGQNLNIKEFGEFCSVYVSDDKNNFYKSKISVTSMLNKIFVDYGLDKIPEFDKNKNFHREALAKKKQKTSLNK